MCKVLLYTRSTTRHTGPMAAASSKLSSTRRLRLVPRALEPRVRQLRKDLRSVIAGLRGERPPAWLPRDGSRYANAPAPGGLATRELEVAEIVRETDDALSLVLRDPGGRELPPIHPGQFFTLLIELDGQTLRRAYSVSSDCRERERVAITIKRVAGGRVSNYLNDHAVPGMRMKVLGPSGEFGCTPEPARAQPRKLVLIAGGSGITPMMALLRTLPELEPDCEIALIYANRRREDVIFAEALDELARRHAPRLTIHHILEHPPAGWSGGRGRGEPAVLGPILDGLALADDPEAVFMLCGPVPMMDGARELLRERGVAPARIVSESFVAPHLRADLEARTRKPQPLTVVHEGREIGLVVRPGQTLLEAGLAAGLSLPYSCAMGGCAACKVELERGEVVMREPNCLGPSEREAGYVLACVASPVSPCRVRVPASSGPQEAS
jgi:ring-1,2-phenylacetyl-CoA epoxidase subunit PaaE